MEFSAQDCKGTVVSWTDCLSPQSVPDPHVKHVKNTTKKVVDDSRYQYVVELTFTEKTKIKLKRLNQRGEAVLCKDPTKVRTNNVPVKHTYRAVVLQSSVSLQDDRAPTSVSYGNFVRASIDAPISQLKAAFAVPGFQGAFVHDVFQLCPLCREHIYIYTWRARGEGLRFMALI